MSDAEAADRASRGDGLWCPGEFAAFAAAPGNIAWAVKDGGRVASVMLVRPTHGGKAARIVRLSPPPAECDTRSEALVSSLLGLVPGRRWRRVDVLVDERDLDSQVFYRGMGFRYAGTRGKGRLYVLRYTPAGPTPA